MRPETMLELKRAARRRERSEEEYREALEAAVAAGASYAEIARWLGISRQAVRKYLTTGGKR